MSNASRMELHVGRAQRPMRSSRRLQAIKVLTTYATNLIDQGHIQELDVLLHLRDVHSPPSEANPNPAVPHFTYLSQAFPLPSKYNPGHGHCCLVFPLYADNVERLHDSFPDRKMSLPLIKRIVKHTVLGLAQIHKQNIAHTGSSSCLRCCT